MNKKPVVILGGGLWGGLLAYRLYQTHPELQVLLIEKNNSFGGNHTWSFHESDLGPESFEWIKPFISTSWPGYEVKFPRYTRAFESHYHAISSEQFNQVLKATLPSASQWLDTNNSLEEAQKLSPLVFDARGTRFNAYPEAGYQKFVGLEVELKNPHGLKLPCLMDAQVLQQDGYRFIYYLPFDSHRLLIEDTRYSHSADLDLTEFKNAIKAEISRKGWEVKTYLREESGVLPLPYAKYADELTHLSLGDLFHDVTGYSLPSAVRLIDAICSLPELSTASISSTINNFRREHQQSRGYLQLLNKLLFQAAEPTERYKVLEHFYRLPEPLIRRFYRGELSASDKVRILAGKPPVPVLKALQILWKHSS